jgi:hypothetical protein
VEEVRHCMLKARDVREALLRGIIEKLVKEDCLEQKGINADDKNK